MMTNNANKKNINKIKDLIEEKESFKEVTIKEFALPDGWANKIAEDLGNKMKTAQLRKVFNSIKLMEQKIKDENKQNKFDDPNLYMLLPHLAYAKGKKLIPNEFYELMKVIISNKIKTIGDFERFCEFMTAIVAYHKQYSK